MRRDRGSAKEPSTISGGHTVPPPALSPSRSARPASTRRTKRWMVLVIGILILLVVASMFLVRLAATRAGARTPGEAAYEFLAAVSHADSARALRFQETAPSNRSMLTDAALDRMRSLDPITNIRVEPVTGDRVVAHFDAGTEPVRVEWPVVRLGDDTWKILRGTSVVTVSFPANLPVVLDGVQLDTDHIEVFPGRHRVETGLPPLAYHPGASLLATGEPALDLAPVPVISDSGRATLTAAARDAWQECLRQRSLSPPGCPQNVRSGDEMHYDPQTIRWTSQGDPFGEGDTNRINPTLGFDDASRVEFPVRAKLRLSVWVTRGAYGNEVNQDIEVATTASANLLANPIKVDFAK